MSSIAALAEGLIRRSEETGLRRIGLSMSERSKITWTHATWNPWIGCTKFSEECANCYADELDRKRFSVTLGGSSKEFPIIHWGKGAPRHSTKQWNAPLAWNRRPLVCECGTAHKKDIMVCNCGSVEFEHRRVFCGSLMDWADEEVSDRWRDRLFDVAERCLDLRFLFLTKRIKNARNYLRTRYYNREIPRHFWIGMSWMQKRPDDVDHLLAIPAEVRFLSVEPMLGHFSYVPGVNWVILGGESGPKARPCNVDWIRDAVRQCQQVGVKVFVKQDSGPKSSQQGRIPDDLWIKEFPV